MSLEKLPGKIRQKIKLYPPFYQKVWLGCRDIPPGQTRSYKWLARHIGHPRAWRAVGQALARNPFAPIIPCHRVIRADGKIGGYSGRGGISHKKQLQQQERGRILRSR